MKIIESLGYYDTSKDDLIFPFKSLKEIKNKFFKNTSFDVSNITLKFLLENIQYREKYLRNKNICVVKEVKPEINKDYNPLIEKLGHKTIYLNDEEKKWVVEYGVAQITDQTLLNNLKINDLKKQYKNNVQNIIRQYNSIIDNDGIENPEENPEDISLILKFSDYSYYINIYNELSIGLNVNFLYNNEDDYYIKVYNKNHSEYQMHNGILTIQEKIDLLINYINTYKNHYNNYITQLYNEKKYLDEEIKKYQNN